MASESDCDIAVTVIVNKNTIETKSTKWRMLILCRVRKYIRLAMYPVNAPIKTLATNNRGIAEDNPFWSNAAKRGLNERRPQMPQKNDSDISLQLSILDIEMTFTSDSTGFI